MEMTRLGWLLCVLAILASGQARRTYSDITSNARKIAGFMNLYWEERAGRMWLEIEKFDSDLLYVTSLPAGLGSNDIGLDRGQLGRRFLVRFERTGPRILMIAPNMSFRALSDNPDERRAVQDSFAQSVIQGFDVAAEEGGKVLVDATGLFMRDAHNAAGTLQRARQGTYRFDPARSAYYLPRTKGFPKNTEVEVTLTLTGEAQGAFVRDVTPSPDAITIRQHHSFIELPDPAGFKPRPFDPRAGYGDFLYRDYATPVTEKLDKRFIPRHRLNPGGQIVYYVDRGAPEPIRTALVEGARWWNQAFEAAGFKDGFKVEVMPEGADPMDVRYNVINWVHRHTRGWSYGASVTDPRTGEILKGHVTLGSLRVRQDYMIAEGVLAPYEDGRTVSPKMLEMGLARLRQLSAHEVGHTLGLSHAYAASTQNRSSVMDYPHPWIDLGPDTVPDLANAYAVGIGEWDKVAINFGYRNFPAGTDERAELDKIVLDAAKKGLVFLTDQDARPEGSIHPKAHLWDSGANAVDELNRLMKVRERVLSRFDQRVIRTGEPMSSLEDALVPIYMLHRYQVEAASKVLGGAEYTFALRGDGQKVFEVVPGAEQRRALQAVLATLKPASLEIPQRILALLPPQANQYGRTRENFRGRTGLAFDAFAAAEATASHAIGLLLHPERAARLVQYSALDAKNPSLNEVIDAIIASTWKAPAVTGTQGELQKTVAAVVLYHLMALSANDSAPPQVRAVARHRLHVLGEWAAKPGQAVPGREEFYFYAAERIRRFEENPKEVSVPKPADPPPGQPIGCDWN
jgi:hypothetical protein